MTVAAGSSATVTNTSTNTSTNTFFFNDALQISAQPPALPATTPRLLAYYSRICPAS